MAQESPIDVDTLVREVLLKLGVAPESGEPSQAGGGGGPSGPSPPSLDAPDAKTRSAATPGPSRGELVVLSQVVTTSELQGRLEGVRRLVVPPGAVVTPSVRDELHRRRIALEYDQPVPVPGAAGVRLVMAVLGSRFDPGPLTRSLRAEAIMVETHRSDCLVAATDQLAAEVPKPSTLGLVVTTDPAVALCLANRHQGVQAILGSDAATVDSEAASVGANVLVVNPGTTSYFQMRQMIRRFCRGGARECPEALRERLG
jgi:hypothetical protein